MKVQTSEILEVSIEVDNNNKYKIINVKPENFFFKKRFQVMFFVLFIYLPFIL